MMAKHVSTSDSEAPRTRNMCTFLMKSHSPLILQPLFAVVAAMIATRSPFSPLSDVEHVLQVAHPGDVLAPAPRIPVDGAGRVGARLTPHAGVCPLDVRHLMSKRMKM